MSKPEIAVIIPLYNGERWIAETLHSVRTQTLAPAEIVVVDDGSQDGGARLAGTFRGVKVMPHPGKGGGRARDFGLAQTVAPLVAFLDQDDVWSPLHLESLAAILSAHPNAVAAAATCRPFGDRLPVLDSGPTHANARKLDMWAHFPFGLIESPSLVLARRTIFQRTGLWTEQTPTMADLELWLHMALHGDLIASDHVTVARRVHHGSYSGSLRTKNISGYLDALLRCAGKLLALRRGSQPAEDAQLESRIDVLRSLNQVTAALHESHAEAFRQAVADYETALAVQPAAFRTTALANMVWFLDPSVRTGNGPRENWWQLFCERQGDSSQLETLLATSIRHWPSSVKWRHWLSRPWNGKRWQLARNSEHWRAVGNVLLKPTHGVDEDGWAEQQCRFEFASSRSHPGVRLQFEIPHWAGKLESRFTLLLEDVELIEVPVKNGCYEICIPSPRPDEAEGPQSLELRFHHVFAMPGEIRQRSARILGVTALTGERPMKAEVRRCKPVETDV